MDTMTPTAPTTETYRLLSQGRSKPFTDLAFLFGHMVRLAQPVMTSFQSDLFHDATWLTQHCAMVQPESTLVLHWYVSAGHTWLGHTAITNPYEGHRHYRFVLWLAENGWWTLQITEEPA